MYRDRGARADNEEILLIIYNEIANRQTCIVEPSKRAKHNITITLLHPVERREEIGVQNTNKTREKR